MCNVMTLARLCSWADRFESYLVENPEDRFSHDMAQIYFVGAHWQCLAETFSMQSLFFYGDTKKNLKIIIIRLLCTLFKLIHIWQKFIDALISTMDMGLCYNRFQPW